MSPSAAGAARSTRGKPSRSSPAIRWRRCAPRNRRWRAAAARARSRARRRPATCGARAWFREPGGAGARGVRTYPRCGARARRAAAPVVAPCSMPCRRTAIAGRFFHWALEFPEVFRSADEPSQRTGFDAVIGNPPWEMLRGDRGDATRARRVVEGARRFARGSGIYRLQGAGHANLYQAFVERMLTLLRARRPARRDPAVGVRDRSRRRRSAARAVRSTRRSTRWSRSRTATACFPIHRGLKFALVCDDHGRPVRVGCPAVSG